MKKKHLRAQEHQPLPAQPKQLLFPILSSGVLNFCLKLSVGCFTLFSLPKLNFGFLCAVATPFSLAVFACVTANTCLVKSRSVILKLKNVISHQHMAHICLNASTEQPKKNFDLKSLLKCLEVKCKQ